MKTLYPMFALSAALMLAACSEDKPAKDTDAAQTATTTEQTMATEQTAPVEQAEVTAEATTEEQMEDTDNAAEESTDSLVGLSRYVGKYPNDGVNFLATPPLSDRLEELLGDDFDKFQENMQTVGPLSEENGLLYITGNKDNDGGNNAAALVINPEQDTLFVWTLFDGVSSAVTEEEEGVTVPVPVDVQTMMENSM